ncbi:MAG TPA: hypothetical protein VMD02_00955 [Candidatus Omnitrophota bacterium]|nr:hypothetical protein [Candidatus Omnitrophota bacterium]
MHRRFVISLIFAALLLAGCSRTITTIPTYGSQMAVEVDFRGNIDLSKNRYFMIISTTESFSYPVLPPDGTTLDEFLEPGDNPVNGNKADYFTKYYSTWYAYIVLDNMGFSLGRGPFSISTPVTREPVAALPYISNVVNFSVRLDQIFGNNIPDTIYFDIVSVDYPTNSLKYLKDRISPPGRNISKIAGSVLTRVDETRTDIDPSLDIVGWSVQIQ